VSSPRCHRRLHPAARPQARPEFFPPDIRVLMSPEIARAQADTSPIVLCDGCCAALAEVDICCVDCDPSGEAHGHLELCAACSEALMFHRIANDGSGQ
jgi:hypothetical protein